MFLYIFHQRNDFFSFLYLLGTADLIGEYFRHFPTDLSAIVSQFVYLPLVFTSFIYEDSKGIRTECYTAVVNSRALKRYIRIVVCPVENGESLVYFSTDTEMAPERIIGFYRTRFQIEFGIRDAKQFTGPQSQQTRDRERLDFAFNLSFTTLNVCKEVIWEDYPDLSVAQFKRLMFESYLASTVISTYGKSPHLKIIQKINQRLAQLAA